MRHFFASVAGESFRNEDGTDRQGIIAGCRVGDPLVLVPEPDNDHDENAIKVLREDWRAARLCRERGRRPDRQGPERLHDLRGHGAPPRR